MTAVKFRRASDSQTKSVFLMNAARNLALGYKICRQKLHAAPIFRRLYPNPDPGSIWNS
jgi:hypothetical protein